MRTDLDEIWRSGGLGLHRRVGRLLHVGFVGQSMVLSGLCAVALLASSASDHSLVLSGRNVGLLQHPTIWAFIALQIALPLSIKRSLAMLAKNGEKIDCMAGKEDAFSKQIVQPLLKFVRLRSFSGRAFGAIAYSAGFAAFVWNTYQNQLPGVVVPYDFWDSSNHLWGFWATRAYKLYLFSWLLPYIAQVHVGILLVVLKAVRHARLAGTLKLNPFCPDGVGGLGFIPPLVTSPILIALVMCSVALAGAFEVHRKLDVTPSIGLAVLLGLSLGAYFVPTMYLRRDIVELKRMTFEKLLALQQEQYARIVDGLDTDAETLSRANEALDYFEKVRERVEKIPTLPHLKRVLNVVGIAITPSALSICVSLYDRLNPILLHLPQKP